jgi:hypothetical protein
MHVKPFLRNPYREVYALLEWLIPVRRQRLRRSNDLARVCATHLTT